MSQPTNLTFDIEQSALQKLEEPVFVIGHQLPKEKLPPTG